MLQVGSIGVKSSRSQDNLGLAQSSPVPFRWIVTSPGRTSCPQRQNRTSFRVPRHPARARLHGPLLVLVRRGFPSRTLKEAERTRQELQAGWQKQFEEAEKARKSSEQTGAALQAQLQQLRQDTAAVLETTKAEAEKREAEIRTEANYAAESAVAERFAAVETARKESELALQAQIVEAESSRIAALQEGTALLIQLDELQKATEADILKVKADAAAEAARIRQEATDAAEAILRDKSEANERTIAEVNAKALEAESKLATLSEQHAAAMVENLNSQREIMEKAKDGAVNIEKAKAFDETQQLSIKVNDLQRALEKKTNEELGEGAEIDLFEALKAYAKQ